ncbi:MAG: cephalosporin hydroxylase family protein [Saprospiraceae bacterium]|uniref:Cephalosporin hydroxylase family protein n=1 Tax=Candidatus Defluviibacterium haderslevense TaxID=2981993 RepID=A0A9D7SAX1_9BACT|nr:cephalosporin hydroxylase family protein [Candidatus Defluviibacterium haderslevense]
MTELERFEKEKSERIKNNGTNESLKNAAHQFNIESNKVQYTYNFTWMGIPIIQFPQDMIAMQEIIWELKPDLIIETGIAHGGSIIFYASILELIGKGEMLGIDIDIRAHNLVRINEHPMSKRIKMIQGSSIDLDIVNEVAKIAKDKSVVLVCLDSNHTHEHVLAELNLYQQFVTKGSYIVVFDTIIEDMPKGMYDRPWDQGNNAKTAAREFLKNNQSFVIDDDIDSKLLVSNVPQGFLKRIS